MAQQTHPIYKFGTSAGIQKVNPNDRGWQAYLGLSYAGIRALTRLRWPANYDQAPAGAALTSLTPDTAVAGGTGGVTTVAVVGTGFVVGQTVFTMDGDVVGGTGVSSDTAASIVLPNTRVGVHSVRALNPGRLPSDPATSFTVTGAAGMAAPTSANTKAEIVAWLLGHGVTLSEAALMNLSKDELLELVDDVQSPT